MASTYTTNLGIEKIGTGEQSGTWGDTTNTNFDILDEAINGIISVTLSSAGSSGSPTALPITDGSSSNGRNKFIEFTDGGDLGGTAYVQLTPNDAEKIVHIRNSLSGSRSVIVFQGTYNASNDFEIANGADVLLKFNGGGSGATVTDVNVDLTVTGATIATADINGGAIDGTVIGGASAAAITATTITGTTITASTAAVPDASDGATLGSASLEWSDLYLADGAVVFFGDDQDITLTHVADTGLTLKHANTGDDKFPTFLLATGDTDIAADDKLGVINFQAPDEGAGTDAILVAAGIEAVSEGDFSASSNATSLVFKTGASEAAAEKFRVTSAGNVGIGTDSPSDLLHIKSTSADAEISLESTNSGGDARIRLIGNSSGSSTIQFQDEGDSNIGFISYLHSDNAMTFRTNDSERMRVDSAGNVGIGTTSPDSNLHIAGSAAASLRFERNDTTITAGNSIGNIHFEHQESGNAGICATLNVSAGDNDGSGEFAFLTGVAGTTTEKVRIDKDGNVGIGTATATYDLTVVGASNLSTIGTNDAALRLRADGARTLQFYTNSNERMRINSSGNVGIGTTGPDSLLHVGTGTNTDGTDVTVTIGGDSANNRQSLITKKIQSDDRALQIHASAGSSDEDIRFFSDSSTERMRITESGELEVGGTVNTSAATIYSESSSVALAAYRKASTSTLAVATFRSDSGGTDSVIARIDVDGDLKNATGSYGSISDARMKNSITDANSQWDDLKKVRVRNYKMNGRDQVHLGVVAQELMEDGMSGLVKHDPDEDQYSVKYSILYMKAVKALQEAMTRIEMLETEVAALKGA